MSRFLNGLVIVLILGMGLTSSFVIDDPYSSVKEAETIEDMTAEMNRLDDLNAKHRDKEHVKDVLYDVSLEQEYKGFIPVCKLESEGEISEKELLDKKDQYHQALRKFYQILQHGKGSFMNDESWLAAKRSEVCSACCLRKLCEKAEILNLLGVK